MNPVFGHNKVAVKLGKIFRLGSDLRYTEKPARRKLMLKDVVEEQTTRLKMPSAKISAQSISKT